MITPTQIIKSGAVASLITLLSSPAFAVLAFDLDFESPDYTAGTVYDSATGTDTLTGTGGDAAKFTKFTRGGTPTNNTWTATVEAKDAENAAAGNWLKFSIPGGTNFSGSFEGFKNLGAEATSGTWFVQFDYTRILGGGILGAMSLVDNGGSIMTTHPNNITLFADKWGGGPTISLGSTATLRLEVDIGSAATDSGRVYQNGSLISSFDAGNNAQIGGFAFRFALGANGLFNSTTEFALDNIQLGQVSVVPEPAAWSLIMGGTLFGMVLFRRRGRSIR
ncbi:MAG: PEP-CTERM sorting domain-containing protein [Verrucomicrobiota bacterium]